MPIASTQKTAKRSRRRRFVLGFASISLLGMVSLAVGSPAALANNRAYELVSPSDAGGQDVIFPAKSGVYSFEGPSLRNLVSEDGDRAYFTANAGLLGFDGTGGSNDPFIADRTPDGWSISYVGPPGSLAPATQLVGTLPDLSGIALAVGGARLDPADEDADQDTDQNIADLYLRDPEDGFTWVSRGSLQPPLASSFDVPVFGGMTPDGSHAIFQANRALEPDATISSLYERTAGQTRIVSLRPDGTPFTSAAGRRLNAISADGNRIVFTQRNSGLASSLSVFVREGGSSTADAGVSRRDPPDTTQAKRFEAVTTDGSSVYISTTEKLIDADTDTRRDLYAYHVADDTLTGVTTSGNGTACSPTYGATNCDVALVGAASDGSRAYFISPEQLDPGAVADAPNLYVFESATAAISIIATLDPQDTTQGSVGAVGVDNPNESMRPVRLSDDGSILVFESRAQLDPSYNNGGHREIYLYRNATGSIECASCRPDGTPPSGDAGLRARHIPFVPANPFSIAHYAVSGPNLTADASRLFFETSDALTPQDTNGKIDVYEYDLASAAVGLVSSGGSSSPSYYYSNSADGDDVFFLTRETLVPQDLNGATAKLYDARLGGGFAFVPPPPGCTGDDCQASPSGSPSDPDPTSANFLGPGNPPPLLSTADCSGLLNKARKANRRAKRASGKKAKRLHRNAKRLRKKASRCQGERGS